MADQRVTSIVRLVDQTTLTQGLTIDSSGRAYIDLRTIVGTAVSVNNGTVDNGCQRVVIASDNTPFAVKTDQTTHGTTDLVAADITKIAGSTVEVAATGIIKVGLTDGSGAEVNLGQSNKAGSLPVTLASDQGALSVSVGTPTNPAWDISNITSPVNIAAGASGNADSADIPSKYLRQLVVSGSVDFKVLLSLNDNGSLTSRVVLFGGPRNPVVYSPPHQLFLQAPAAGAGTQGFRAAITNLDTSETADFYVSFAYADD